VKIVRRVEIRAKPELIWDVITDLRGAKEWAPGFEDYPYISEEWPKQGSEAIWRYHAGLMSIDFKLKMKDSERGKRLCITNSGAFGLGIEDYRFQFANGLTIVGYETSSEPSLLGRIMMPLMRKKLLRQIDTTIANLKVFCERKENA